MRLLEARFGKPAVKNITVIRNDTFNQIIRIWDDFGNPGDGTGYEFLMQVKKNCRTEDLVIDIDNSYFIVTNDQFGVDAGVNNLIVINFPHEEMNIKVGDYIYDLQVLKPTNIKRTLLKGDFIVNKDISE